MKSWNRWTPGIERALQNKEMKGIQLHKNQELHSRNKFEEIWAHLKAPSFKAFVFKKARGKFDCLASTLSSKSGGRANKFFCSASYGVLKQATEEFHKRWIENVGGQALTSCAQPLMEPSNTKLRRSMRGQTKIIALTSHGAFKQVVQMIHERPNAICFCFNTC